MMPTTKRSNGRVVNCESNLPASLTLFGAVVSGQVYRHRIDRRFHHLGLWVDRRGEIVAGGSHG